MLGKSLHVITYLILFEHIIQSNFELGWAPLHPIFLPIQPIEKQHLSQYVLHRKGDLKTFPWCHQRFFNLLIGMSLYVYLCNTILGSHLFELCRAFDFGYQTLSKFVFQNFHHWCDYKFLKCCNNSITMKCYHIHSELVSHIH